MSRVRRDAKLDTRSARLRLKTGGEPYWTMLARGEALGYYRPADGGAGTWRARVLQAGGGHRKAAIGMADDYADADGQEVLNFAQAQAKAREWFDRARLDNGEEVPQRGPFTVADAWALYLNDCARRGVKRPDRLGFGAKHYILPALGHIEVEKLTQRRIEKWHSEMAASAPRRRAKKFADKVAEGPVPSTPEQKRKRRASANRVLTMLKSALNIAKRQQKVTCTADTWREVQPFGNADAARVGYLNLEEQARLVNACEPDFRRIVQGGLFTGARIGELARLKAEDFDPENESVFIAPGKNGKGRHVFLAKEGVAFFLEAVAGLEGGALIFTHEAFNGRQWLQPRAQRAWKVSDHQRPMRAACEAAKIAPLGFHQLRHSYASALIAAKIPLAYVAEMLGHTGTRMVEKHYGHLAPSAIKDAIRALAPRLGIHTPGKVEGLKIKCG